MSKLLCTVSFATLCLSAAFSAYADDSGAPLSDASVYGQSDFERFAPSSALDMVRNIPGFSILRADDKRGLGQADGNVLINGRRVSTKSTSIYSVLDQISASNVTKITVQDASHFDIPGLTGEIANIETEVTGFSGQWSWNPVFRQHRSAWLPNGDLSISGQKGPFDFTVTLENEIRRNQARGPEFIRDADGSLKESRNESFHFNRDTPSISTRIGYNGANGSVGNFNFNFEAPDWDFTEWSDRTGENGDTGFRVFEEGAQEWEAEINADYEFDLGPGRLKLIGLYGEENDPYFNRVHFAQNGELFSGAQTYTNDETEKETIIRSEYSWTTNENQDWQISAEGALNSLDSSSRVTSQNIEEQFDFDNISKATFPDTVHIASGKVEEKRGEINFTHGRPLSSKLALQASLGVEYSEIALSGFIQQKRDFVRPKGFVNLSYALSPDLNISTRLSREAGQLDFGDFIASTDIAEGNDNANNSDLVPEQTWRLETEIAKQHGAWGSATLTLAAEEIEDIIEQVPLSATDEAPGNLDTPATRIEAIWNGTFNFDPLGIEGLKIDYTLEAFESNLKDPLTGEDRRIGDDTMTYIELDLRYDIPNTNWALSAYMETARTALAPRLDRNLRVYRDDPFIGATIEHKDFFGMKAEMSVRNLGNQDESVFKERYIDRRDSPVFETEYRTRKYDTYVQFTFSGDF